MSLSKTSKISANKNNGEYSDITMEITKTLSKEVKKSQGIFITPQTIITLLVDRVDKIVSDQQLVITNILEPSCGTCEIIRHIDNKWSGKNITGVEFNTTIYNRISGIQFSNNNVTLLNQDFTKFQPPHQTNYDLIIGNPPYFVIRKETVPPQYEEYINGRPNIFGLFIIHSLSMLAENGILAFIVPTSFLNSAYYSKIREYIHDTCKIIDIIDFKHLNLFIDTEQDTFGLVIQKTQNKESQIGYSYKFGNNYIFTSNYQELVQLLEGSTTLKNLGLFVKTGNVVWNQHKDKLTSDPSEGALLLYNSNITQTNEIEIKSFKNDEKLQYINIEGTKFLANTGCCIVVNRGNGNSEYKLNYSLVKGDVPYLAENHLNVIDSSVPMTPEKKMELFQKVVDSFKNPKTQQFINLFLGNNGLSKTELETIFPIYI
jgi:type I restriction-modification system DNA methylase subunit